MRIIIRQPLDKVVKTDFHLIQGPMVRKRLEIDNQLQGLIIDHHKSGKSALKGKFKRLGNMQYLA